MFPFVASGLLGSGGVVFVGKVDGPNSSGPVTFPVGTAVGDLGVIVTNIFSGSISGWTKFTQGTRLAVFYKLLTAGDISSPPASIGTPSIGSGAFGVLVYRGPVKISNASAATDSTAPITIPGFGKSGGRGILVTAVTAGTSIAAPTNFTQRQNMVTDGFSSVATADLFDPSLYTNGTDIDWTPGGGSGGVDTIAFELI